MHVFGPFERFPLAAERAYTVPEAPLAEHERVKSAVGLERTVLVQASGHGTDNRAMLAGMESLLVKSKTNIVIDHMGLPDAAAGIDQPGFQTVLRLLRSANIWVKLAGADRITRGTGNLRDAILPYRDLDAGELLDVLIEAVPDAGTRHAILARNLERLYGFDS